MNMSEYKLYNGDCFKVLPKINSNSIDLIIADPPYNLGVADWDTIENYEKWCVPWLDECVRILKEGGSFYVFGVTPQIFEIYNLLKNKLTYKNEIIWYFSTGYPSKTKYRTEHENALFFTKGETELNHDEVRIKFETEDKRHNPKGKSVGTVIREKRIMPNYGNYMGHPTQKPENIIKTFIKASSKKGDVVLDPFLGSGTTMKCAQDLGRSCIGIELSSKYVEMIKTRCWGRQFLDRKVKYEFMIVVDE